MKQTNGPPAKTGMDTTLDRNGDLAVDEEGEIVNASATWNSAKYYSPFESCADSSGSWRSGKHLT